MRKPEESRLRLMVIVADALSDITRKGEVVERYYNPGNIFDEVHIVLINDDHPDPAAVQPMVGSARLILHNHAHPTGKAVFLRTLGFMPRLLRSWAQDTVNLAASIRPALVRCHNNQFGGFLAFEIKRQLGIPYAMSLHGNPDVDYFRGRLARDWKERLMGRAIEAMETVTIQNADIVLPVYMPILPYLNAKGVTRFELIYNVVGRRVRPKQSYALNKDHVRAICVGRQQSLQKDPTPIIEAVAEIPNLNLLLVGTGDLHEQLKQLAAKLGAGDRIQFSEAMPNAQVLEMLPSFDFYLYSSINYEVSKTCMEAALAGLPIILNDRDGNPAPELVGPHFRLVSGTKASYRDALKELIDNDGSRERLGRAAAAHARRHWDPDINEARYAAAYNRLLDTAHN